MIKNAVLIGSGNMATCLGLALQLVDVEILQVCSRTIENASLLAKQLNARAICDLNQIDLSADLYILSVSDNALIEVVSLMPLVDGIVVHTSGSTPMSILSKFSNNGVFYPFQTLSKQVPVSFQLTPILLEACNLKVQIRLKLLAHRLTINVLEANTSQRFVLHLSAVFASNFTNAMYHISEQLLNEVNLPFSLLYPIISETAQKIQYLSPKDAQTGPAVRNDDVIINKHIDYLSNREEIAQLYKEISVFIQHNSLAKD